MVGVSCIRLNYSAFLLTCLRWLMVFKLNGLGVQRSWVLSEQKGLDLDKLDVGVFVFLTWERSWNVNPWTFFICLWLWFCWGWKRVILRKSLRSCIDVWVYRGTNSLPVLSWSRSWLTVCCLFVRWATTIKARWSAVEEAGRGPRVVISANFCLVTCGRLSNILVAVRCETLALSIKILRRGALILKRPISTSHSISCMVSSFDWSISHIECLLLISLALLRITQARAARWLSNLHPWRECVFEKYPSILVLTSIFGWASLLTIYATAWWDWVVMVAVMRWNDIIALEMVSWDALSLRMFLITSSAWVEEVVNWLEGSATLSRYLLVLICKRIL